MLWIKTIGWKLGTAFLVGVGTTLGVQYGVKAIKQAKENQAKTPAEPVAEHVGN